MPYKVKQNKYRYDKGDVVATLVDTSRVIEEALTSNPPWRGGSSPIRDRKSIEEKINSLGETLSRLLAVMLDNDTLTPDDITHNIVGGHCDFDGEIVEVPAEDGNE
jgi:hypothetical protein